MAKRKQTSIDLQRKLLILDEVSKGIITKTQVAEKFGIPKSTLSTIIKNADKINVAAACGSFQHKMKRMRTAVYEDVEVILLEWFNHMRSANVPLSGPLIKEKACEIASDFGIENFNCSSGWLWRFQQRHHISSVVVCGEANKVSEKEVTEWIVDFERIRHKYTPRDIFNMDETGIFYNLLPCHTLSIKGQKCHGGTQSKQRLTVVLVCNSDGSEKHQPWVIGKSKNPRCFKHIDKDKLPCKYTHHTKAWIDTSAFRQFLLQFNRRMMAQNRHVLLTLDNCSSHNLGELTLSNVNVQFFPANTTSRLQPLDQDIIALLKRAYRIRLVRAAIRAIEEDTKIPTWNVLDAIRAIKLAWETISAEAISKCYDKAWKLSNLEDTESQNIVDANKEPEEWKYLQSFKGVRNLCFLKVH